MKLELTRFITDDDMSVILYAETKSMKDDGRFYYWPSFYHNGHEWRGWVAGGEFLDIDDLKSSIHYDECLTRHGRMRPQRAIQNKVIDAIQKHIDENCDKVISNLQKLRADEMKLKGVEDTSKDEEIASLKVRLAAAEQEASKADVNAIIMNSVVQAITPQIIEKINKRVGQLAECVPTRLEVKLADEVREVGEGVFHEKFETVLNLVAAGMPVWLFGEAGTGKSELCKQVAKAIGAEYRYSGAILDEFAGLKGFIDANGKKHGTQFTEALDLAKQGIDVVMCLDECDGSTPEVLLVLNNLLSGGNVECMGECYEMNDHLHIIACGNTNGRGGDVAYTRSIIDSATLDRFFMVDIDYSQKIDLLMAGGDAELANFCRDVRSAARRCGIDLLVTYRSINRLAKMQGKMDEETLLEGALLRGLGRSDMETLRREVRNGGKWLEALKNLASKAC